MVIIYPLQLFGLYISLLQGVSFKPACRPAWNAKALYNNAIRSNILHARHPSNLRRSSTGDDDLYEDFRSVDLYGDSDITDGDILAKMREAKILYNDGWQSTIFRDEHVGLWTGNTVIKYRSYIDI
jgi:hypothetical protein